MEDSQTVEQILQAKDFLLTLLTISAATTCLFALGVSFVWIVEAIQLASCQEEEKRP